MDLALENATLQAQIMMIQEKEAVYQQTINEILSLNINLRVQVNLKQKIVTQQSTSLQEKCNEIDKLTKQISDLQPKQDAPDAPADAPIAPETDQETNESLAA